jgi:hypothetical protein
MRSQIILFPLALAGLAAACRVHGIRTIDDGRADGGVPLARDGGSIPGTEAGTANGGFAGIDGGFGIDAGTGTGGQAVDAGGGITAPDSSVSAPDAPMATPDGDIPPRLDSAMHADQPSDLDSGTITGNDGGVTPDVPPARTDVEVAGLPDAPADAAMGADAAEVFAPPACNVPSCWADLMRDCQPVGSCVEQSAAGNDNLCFTNGVKVLAVVNETAKTMTTTVKSGGRICYELDWNLAGGSMSGAASTGTIKNGDGVTVATISDDASGYSVVTCSGAQPVVMSEWCDIVGNAQCAAGACGP